MKKLKKLSKNNIPKFKVAIIYGTVAVGKFTVASELQKIINYKFFHNHQVHDLVREFFERDTFHLAHLLELIYYSIFREIADARINVITTHTYSSRFVSKTGQRDSDYMKKIESIIEKGGGRAYFIHLIADEREILKRVSGKSRKNYRKLKDKKIMKDVLQKWEWRKIAPVKNNIQIDNTKLSAKKVAKIIQKHFNL
jgi:shikimate kinase